MRANWFKRYLLPGFILKSVIIGGGYATGREFAAFFLIKGPVGALVGVAVATLLFSLVYAASLEFARVHATYEYRGFFRALLGRGWVLFEILYVAILLLVLAVLTATVSAMLAESVGLAAHWGALLFGALVVGLVLFGTTGIERYLVTWSFVLYAFYVTFVTLCMWKFGGQAIEKLSAARLTEPVSSFVGGLKYAGYNISAMTATFFCARHFTSRRDAVVGGLLAGPLAMLPGTLFVIASFAFYPSIVTAPVPMQVLLRAVNLPVFEIAFLLVVVTALLGTASALIHAVNERVAAAGLARHVAAPVQRGGMAVVLMLLSTVVAERIGLIALVEKGYGIITFGFIAVFMIPILTIGVWKLLRRGPGVTAYL